MKISFKCPPRKTASMPAFSLSALTSLPFQHSPLRNPAHRSMALALLFSLLTLAFSAPVHAQAGSQADNQWSTGWGQQTGSGTETSNGMTFATGIIYDGLPHPWDDGSDAAHSHNGILDELLDGDGVFDEAYPANWNNSLSTSVSINGTITSTRHWLGSGPPPKTISVLEVSTVTCEAGISGWADGVALPVDAFNDPVLPGNPNWYIYSEGNGGVITQSTGQRLVQVDSSSGVVALSGLVSGFASTPGLSNGLYPGSSHIYATFDWYVVSSALQGYSTHCAPALQGSDPNWDATHPRYFSGTGCEAIGTAVPASGYLTHAQLCVNDTVVKEYWDTTDPGCPNPVPTDGSVVTNTPNTHNYSQQLKALFDSTHFMDSTMIVLKMKVWDSNGGYYDGTIQGLAKNRAYILANQSADPSTTISSYAVQAFDEVNYSTLGSSQDHEPTVLQRLPHNSAFFTISHGSEDNFADSFFSPAPNAQYDPNVEADYHAIFTAMAVEIYGYPSYNPNLVPYNFVYLDACECAGFTSHPVNPHLANAFGIYDFNSDRAFLGWHNEVTAAAYTNQTWNERLWNYLVNGDTLQVAILKSCILGEPQGELVHGVEPNTDVRPVFIGDGRMKLHGVYLGTDAGQWFKPL